MPDQPEAHRRILIVDDNRAIHEDFAKILTARPNDRRTGELAALEDALAGSAPAVPGPESAVFSLASAFQGREARDLVVAARAAGKPFALAFVDMRMPPGWDGLETIEKIWKVDPEIQIVICSAYSDRSWAELRERLGARDNLLILKKPFDTIEVVQCAHAMTEKWRLAGAKAAELRLAHKLEAIGELAAGVAHEIATPVQYVGNGVEYIRELAQALLATIGEVRAAVGASGDPALVAKLAEIAARHDLDTVARATPGAIDEVEQGLGRITAIVRAMNQLAHPGTARATPTDLNRLLTATLEISASRYRYVAELETQLAPIPPITCFASDLTQVFLNLIVNAAHAIEDRGGARGRLLVRSRLDGDDVVVSISDTGCGIPLAARAHIFEPFFTTKEAGRGSGQGLAISRAMVVDRHGGSLTFATELGVGTTFDVRVPVGGPRLRAGRTSSLPVFRAES